MAKAKKATQVKKTPVKTAKKNAVAAAKSAVKKSSKSASINIKYADKSAGQPELVPVFETIRKMLTRYDKKRNLVLHMNTYGQANLVSHKPVEIAGRKKDDIWFVSALIQKGYVGFYYMPVYMNETVRKQLHPDLMKCLKGKACFHIKKDDPAMMKNIQTAIELGYDAFVKLGWI
jgi:hypothetical protein